MFPLRNESILRVAYEECFELYDNFWETQIDKNQDLFFSQFRLDGWERFDEKMESFESVQNVCTAW